VEHDSGFYSDLGADLFMFMELISKIEDEFGKAVTVVKSTINLRGNIGVARKGPMSPRPQAKNSEKF